MEITVTAEWKEYVASKVASGKYCSESEVFAAGLESLQAEEQDVDQWLIEAIGPAYDEMQAYPERGIPIEKVFAELRRHHDERVKTLA